MKLERAAESVAANTPRAISSGRTLIYFTAEREDKKGEVLNQSSTIMIIIYCTHLQIIVIVQKQLYIASEG